MENLRPHGNRKRYCCFYCNTYFYQVDAWQRHNRKHTGVEIECDDCGDMFSDHYELKTHQRVCEAFHIYSEDMHMSIEEENKKLNSSTEHNDIHETPDSTSKQELNNNESKKTNCQQIMMDRMLESKDDDCKELDHLIGEDTSHIDDADNESLIGIDRTAEQNRDIADQVGVDSTIIIKVDDTNIDSDTGVLNRQKNVAHLDLPSYDLNRMSPSGSNADSHSVNMENSETCKKYQPYFCKNCGARFTRKDSVTRHLKKGTCSGKSAIVCNVCGKVFMEVLGLQEHCKLEHKNVMFGPNVLHQSVRPRGENERNFPSAAYQQHFESHVKPVSQPHIMHDQPYRPVVPAIQSVFHGGPSYQMKGGYLSQRNNFHEQRLQMHPIDSQNMEASSRITNEQKKYNHELPRKREYQYRGEIRSYEDKLSRKFAKVDDCRHQEYHQSPSFTSTPSKNINLSEYTNNAMSKQYYDQRFVKSDALSFVGSEEPRRLHQCKICSLEFPRFDYLLTHLRKHKEKSDVENKGDIDDFKTGSEYATSKDSSRNSEAPSDDHDNQLKSRLILNSREKTLMLNQGGTLEPMPIVLPQTNTSILSQHSRENFHQNMLINQQARIASKETVVEAITPGIDGKFRPFICENCGQRFTRKDSLVRHERKQTCYEEMVDLKCQECDKSFRYHKCLNQHQELVHGIKKMNNSDDEYSESEKSEEDEKKKVRLDSQSTPIGMMELNAYTKVGSQRRSLPNPPSQVYSQQPYDDLRYGTISGDRIKSVKSNEGTEYSTFGFSMLPRPFQCEYCGDRFAHRHSLKRHVRRHLGIGIPCHDCGKLYRDQSEWRRHQRSIHNRHYEKCDVPNRISFRDGLAQGLIGVVPHADYESRDLDESESSDDEMSTKERFDEKQNNDVIEKNFKAEEMERDGKLKALDFHSNKGGDKDSRKSVLDSYLFTSEPVETNNNIVTELKVEAST